MAPHPFGVQVDDKFMRPLLKEVGRLGLIPFVHVGLKPYESLAKLEVLAEEFPSITFVALAALARLDDADDALQVGRRQKNILFDTGPIVWAGDIGVGRFVKQVGADRLLFGSDNYGLSSHPYHNSASLENVRSVVITEEERDKILFRNARNLFRL